MIFKTAVVLLLFLISVPIWGPILLAAIAALII